MNPLRNTLPDVLGIRRQQPIWHQAAQTLNGGHQLHLIIRRLRLRTCGHLLDPVAEPRPPNHQARGSPAAPSVNTSIANVMLRLF